MHGWDPNEIKEEIGRDVYKGYELKMAMKLFEKIPKGTYEFEDVFSEIRMYALEAVDMYNPSNKAVFTTFLYKHLSIRCMQWFNWAWLKKNYPAGGYVAPFSAFETIVNPTGDIREAFDPTKVESNVVENLEVKDLFESLSETSRIILQKAFTLIDDDLIKAFRLRKYKIVGRLLQLSEEQIFSFVAEFKKIAPVCIGGVDNV